MKKYLIVMNGWKATPDMFETREAAEVAAKKIKTRFRRVYKCVAIDEGILQQYVEDVFGDTYYTTYDVFTGAWYIHERAPHETAACDWCSLGGKFCEYCTKYREDPYENCGKEISFNMFFDWFEKGGAQ